MTWAVFWLAQVRLHPVSAILNLELELLEYQAYLRLKNDAAPIVHQQSWPLMDQACSHFSRTLH